MLIRCWQTVEGARQELGRKLAKRGKAGMPEHFLEVKRVADARRSAAAS